MMATFAAIALDCLNGPMRQYIQAMAAKRYDAD
jgi:hypothetical protein